MMVESAANMTGSSFGAAIEVSSTTKLGHIMVLASEQVPMSNLKTNLQSTVMFSTVALVKADIFAKTPFNKHSRESSNLLIVLKNVTLVVIRTPIAIVVLNLANAKPAMLGRIVKLIYAAVLCAVTTDSVLHGIWGVRCRSQKRHAYAKGPGWENIVTRALVLKWILNAETGNASPLLKLRLPANAQTDTSVQTVNNDRHVKNFVKGVFHTLVARRMFREKSSLVVIRSEGVHTSMRAMTIRMTDSVHTKPMRVT